MTFIGRFVVKLAVNYIRVALTKRAIKMAVQSLADRQAKQKVKK